MNEGRGWSQYSRHAAANADRGAIWADVHHVLESRPTAPRPSTVDVAGPHLGISGLLEPSFFGPLPSRVFEEPAPDIPSADEYMAVMSASPSSASASASAHQVPLQQGWAPQPQQGAVSQTAGEGGAAPQQPHGPTGQAGLERTNLATAAAGTVSSATVVGVVVSAAPSLRENSSSSGSSSDGSGVHELAGTKGALSSPQMQGRGVGGSGGGGWARYSRVANSRGPAVTPAAAAASGAGRPGPLVRRPRTADVTGLHQGISGAIEASSFGMRGNELKVSVIPTSFELPCAHCPP
jgi:hypothetical protein